MQISETFKKNIKNKELFNEITGQVDTKNQLLSALITSRHVILVGYPGIGKTTLAKNVASLLPEMEVNDCGFNCLSKNPLCPNCKTKKQKTKKIKGRERFIRIQGSPDLTVEDLLGDIDPIKALKFGPLSIEAFTPGKIFKANNGVLFFDEINRCPEKLQNALLQVLEEGKATIGSYDVDFPTNFILIATMNPDDFVGTEKLSEVLLDRFDMVYMAYPESVELEKQIVLNKGEKIKEVNFDDSLLNLVINFIHNLRNDDDLEIAPSVRASLGLYERSQSNALIKGGKDVGVEDVMESVYSVLAHRIKLKPSLRYLMKPEEFLKKRFRDFLEDKENSGEYP